MITEVKEILYSAEQISARVKDLGQAITEAYQGKAPVLVGILKGAVPFLNDMMRAIELPLSYDLMAVSSYGAATTSSGTVRIRKDLDLAIEGRDILVIEDLIDTGLTIHYVLERLHSRKPRSLKVCTLLDKPARRRVAITPDYNGFTIPDVFVVGYGLDYAEEYRNLPYIGVLHEAIYKNGGERG